MQGKASALFFVGLLWIFFAFSNGAQADNDVPLLFGTFSRRSALTWQWYPQLFVVSVAAAPRPRGAVMIWWLWERSCVTAHLGCHPRLDAPKSV